MRKMKKRNITIAFAVVDKKNGNIFRNMAGRYCIYESRSDAVNVSPLGSEVRVVKITALPSAKDVKGILK